MLNQLFRPAWQSTSADKRRKAVSEMDGTDAEAKAILLDLATSDEDRSVRLVAIDRLCDLEQLTEVLQNNPDGELKKAVERRLEDIICGENITNNIDFAGLLERCMELRPRVAAFASSADTRKMALQLLTDDQQMQVLNDTAFTDSRQHIAEQLDDIENLETARKILRGKDKKAERIVKNKIDAYRENQRRQQQNQAQVDKLIEEAEYLAEHDWLPEFKARCAVHRQQWDGIDFEIDESDHSRYNIARQKVEAQLERQRIVEEVHHDQRQLVETLRSRMNDYAGFELSRFRAVLNDIEAELNKSEVNWAEWVKLAEPEEAINNQYLKLSGAMRSASHLTSQLLAIIDACETVELPDDRTIQQIKNLLKHFDWPSDLNELRVVADQNVQLQSWQDRKKADAEAYREKLDRLHRNINRIFHFSRAGNLPRARQMAQKVEKALAQIDDKDSAALQDRYSEALKLLDDMGDWKNYATEPKYLELCESMERLIESSVPVEKRFENMKALQKQWKALGHSDVSEQYWPRFMQASDTVYQPCAEYFQQRRQLQKDNIDKRQQYVDQMRDLHDTTDWENKPDYKALQSKFYEINSQFTAVKDVEHRAGQKQWRQFSSLKDKLKARLAVAYDENIEIKRRLVSQAQQLAETPANLDHQDKLKSLQARWSAVGITRRKQDQTLWVEFKRHCDAVYNQIQALRRDARQENDRLLDGRRRIIRDLKQLSKEAGSPQEAERLFTELQREYSQLAELPPQIPQKLIEGIHRDFVNACQQVENRQQQLAGRQQIRLMDALREKARLCELLEAQNLSSSEPDLEPIENQWKTIEIDDPALHKRIESRRESAGSDLDRSSIAERRRMLCLQLEIAMDMESPVEDRALRMQYQLEKLNRSGLGQQANLDKEWLKNIELDWLCMPGAEPSAQRELNLRFQHALRGGRKLTEK